MRRKSYADMACSVAQALEVVGDPWTLLIVRDALFGFSRFEDFQRRLGIPRNTLAVRLASLTEHEVFARVEYQTRPARFEYRLTDKGRDLLPVLLSLLTWGDAWGGLDPPPVVFENASTGESVEPRMVDLRTGRPIDEVPLRAVANDTASASVAPETPGGV